MSNKRSEHEASAVTPTLSSEAVKQRFDCPREDKHKQHLDAVDSLCGLHIRQGRCADVKSTERGRETMLGLAEVPAEEKTLSDRPRLLFTARR